ncbi:MAG TPA: hypothetical protein VNZ52_14650 [Candidatus Thermoplasmatota archaeon]|nr:hypothetical protein [Candidatus Thermoplasmatota archaeon]
MALSSPNEPTEGTGGSPVIDSTGEYVGTVANIPVPSEDLARVAILLDPATRTRHELVVNMIDVEASWLAPDPEDHARLRLDRPLDEALQEQGFNVAPEVPGREPVFGHGEREPL